MDPSNLISSFDLRDPTDVMLIESYLPGLIQCSRLKKKGLIGKAQTLLQPLPSFSTRVFFNNTSKPKNPITFKILKNTGSLSTISSSNSFLNSYSSSRSSNHSYNMICNSNKWFLLANSISPPPSTPAPLIHPIHLTQPLSHIALI